MAATREEQMVFGIVETTDGQPPIVLLGIPAKAWEYMRDGKTHTFDLSKAGYPMRLMLYGAADHDAAKQVVEQAAAACGAPLLDQRRKDFSIRGGK